MRTKIKLIWILFIILHACSSSNFTNKPKAVYTNLELDEKVNEDDAILEIIQPYKKKLNDKMKLVIGYAKKELNNHPGKGESTLGNFIADLILEQSQKRYHKRIDMAIINAHGGLRASIRKGPITVECIYEVMPFDNTILLLEIDGALITKVFDHSAKTLKNNIAGATFSVKNGRAASINIGGKPFDPKKKYLLAISDYLANGGGGFNFLKEVVPLIDLDYFLRDMILDQIKSLDDQGKKVYASIDGRIKITDNE